jgi:hypothetical protein
MTSIYIRVKQGPVGIGSTWTAEQKANAMVSASKQAIEPLKNWIIENLPDLAYSPSNLYASLVLYVSDKTKVKDILLQVRQLEFVEVAEIVD